MDVSSIQDNLANPLDKLLAFCNGLLNGGTSEALKLGALIVMGAIKSATLAITGAITGASISVTGAVNAASIAATGAITGASYAGGTVSGTTGTFTGAVTGVSYAGGTVDGTTITASTSMVSPVGFKAIIGPFSYFNSTHPGGSVGTNMVLRDQAAGAATQVQMFCVMPFAGSVVGIGADYYGGTVTTTAVTVFKNTSTTLIASTAVVGSGVAFTFGKVSFSKGVNAFAAGDRLSVNVTFGTSGNCGAQVYLLVEMGA